MNTTTDVRTTLVIDRGPVWIAALILVNNSTLLDHVVVTDDGYTATVEHRAGAVPFALWGSGTQALWRLLSSMAYSGEVVSLYEVTSHLDAGNRAAVADALAAYCGAIR